VAEWQTQRTQKQEPREEGSATPRETAGIVSELARAGAGVSPVLPRNAAAKEDASRDASSEVEDLRRQIDALQAKLDAAQRPTKLRLVK
jgi:hypothetical protein